MHLRKIFLSGIASLLLANPSYADNNRQVVHKLEQNSYSQEFNIRDTSYNLFTRIEAEEEMEEDAREYGKKLGKILIEDIRASLEKNWSKYKNIERIINDFEIVKESVEFEVSLTETEENDETEEEFLSSTLYNEIKFSGIEPKLRLGIETILIEEVKGNLYGEMNFIDLDTSVNYSIVFLYIEGGFKYSPEDNDFVSSISFKRNF